MRPRIHQVMRTMFLGALLGLLALVVPDSTPAPADFTLVKLEKTAGVDVDPDVVWILAVGADTRPREDPLHSRADALQLVGMNTKTGAATAIGIPRDSWVPIQGVGSNRVNASLYFGGPQLLGKTVGRLVGIEPDYVMLATFSGLADLVTSIGGITVDNPRAFSDEHLNPKGFKKGRIKVNGMRAVVFGRIRHSLPAGDFDRSANQQRVLRGIQRRVAERSTEAGFIEGGVLNVLKHLHTKGVSPAELFRIAQAVAQVDPAKITTCVLPGGIGNIGGASVVIPDRAAARRYGNDARKDATIKRC